VLKDQRIKPELAARIEDPKSGRILEVHTTEPGVQFYTGNFLDGSPGSGGFQKHAAFCLETQHFPDTPNQKSFPTTELRPGQAFRSTTVHKFSAN
jgi:aldose 1-epimerase